MTWLYAGVGLLALAVVAVLGAASYGAKISFTIFGITIQPSEFVKIIFVFFVAGMFHQSREFKQVVITTVAAAAHVIILVASKDLGGALIFFVVYIVMLYVATGNPFYFIGGLASGSVAAVIAYRLFAHIRVRAVSYTPEICYLKDRYGVFFPVKNHCNECYNVIYNSRPLQLLSILEELKSFGIASFRLSFTTETKGQAEEILNVYEKHPVFQVKEGQAEKEMPDFMEVEMPKIEYTYGHYKRGVE